MMVLDSSLGSKITIIGCEGVFIVDGELDGDSGNHGECGFLASHPSDDDGKHGILAVMVTIWLHGLLLNYFFAQCLFLTTLVF